MNAMIDYQVREDDPQTVNILIEKGIVGFASVIYNSADEESTFTISLPLEHIAYLNMDSVAFESLAALKLI